MTQETGPLVLLISEELVVIYHDNFSFQLQFSWSVTDYTEQQNLIRLFHYGRAAEQSSL